MKKSFLIKICAMTIVFLTGLIGFSFSYKSETRAINPGNTPEKIIDASGEIANFRNWTKISEKPARVASKIAALCERPTREQLEEDAENPHNDKYINVYVNDTGKDEMLGKKQPKFPVGTVIVKEKLSTAESTDAELLTVMIKREKDYNPTVGDWEFLTFNGAGTETTARGKLQNCQTCHLLEKATDYVSRRGYFPLEARQKLK